VSTSYPYLAIARQQNEDYGLVLHFADLVKYYMWHTSGRSSFGLFGEDLPAFNIWQQRAAGQLTIETKRLIICKVAGEDYL
jgi:hypothetical protein